MASYFLFLKYFCNQQCITTTLVSGAVRRLLCQIGQRPYNKIQQCFNFDVLL